MILGKLKSYCDHNASEGVILTIDLSKHIVKVIKYILLPLNVLGELL